MCLFIYFLFSLYLYFLFVFPAVSSIYLCMYLLSKALPVCSAVAHRLIRVELQGGSIKLMYLCFIRYWSIDLCGKEVT